VNQDQALNRRIEEAALNAWPAHEQMLLDGWVLRFAGGYTRRANSVTPLYEAHAPPAPKIAACEALYRARGLPAVFRLTSFAPAELDELLAEHGYRRDAETSVMWRDLRTGISHDHTGMPIHEADLESWLATFARLDGEDAHQQHLHRALLERIPARRLLAQLADNAKPVACGLGVLETDFFGLFDIVADPQMRGRGYGTTLVAGMLQWARSSGARHAYLQVMANNIAAHHLYTKLGFQKRYSYWYWVRQG
jgi:ribosomal protein S18 acetylase RimI-like enzyme